MNLTVNYAALAATTFSSRAIGPLDSIAHPLEPGLGTLYGEVWLENQMLGTFTIDVVEGGSGEQVDVDLSDIANNKAGNSPHFQLGRVGSIPAFAVFFCSGEPYGLHATLRNKDETHIYDSRELVIHDYYVLTPVRPGRYLIDVAGARAKDGVLTVEQARQDKDGRPRPSAKGVNIVVTDGLEPRESRIVSGDGVVFEIRQDGVSVFLLLEPPKQKETGPRPVGIRYPGRRP
jgi:hypothetical protein